MAAKKAPKKEKVNSQLPTPVEDRLAALRELYPEAFAEGKLDLAKLRDATGDIVDDRTERYSFSWSGKRDAIRLLQTPSRATLVPCPDESVDWDTTRNLFIEGDNLEVLKLLYKSYAGRVKLIYIDPPYNTGQDFIYPDNFTDPLDTYLKLTGQKDANGNLLTSNPESNGRYHSAWLSMMYPRLFLARQFLREDGYIVVSLDDVEHPNARLCLNEIFGEENFIATLVWDRNRKNDAKFFSVGHEYMLVYARNKPLLKQMETCLRVTKEGVDDIREEFDRLRKLHRDNWSTVQSELKSFFSKMDDDDSRKVLSRFSKVDDKGPYRDDGNINWPGGGGPMYEVFHPTTGKPCKKPRSGWRYPTKERFDEEVHRGRIVFGPDETTVPRVRTNLFENAQQVLPSVQYSYAQTAANEFDAIFDGLRVFENPKSFRDIAQITEYLSDVDDCILDFFAGSGTTAHAVFHLNQLRNTGRHFVCVQIPEPANSNRTSGKNALSLGLQTIADIAKERIRRVSKVIRSELKAAKNSANPVNFADLGFRVFQLAPSAHRQWSGVPERDSDALGKQMALFVDPLLPGWKPLPVIHEVAMREGYSLSCRVEEVPKNATKPNTVYRVTDSDKEQTFRICLDDKVSPGIVKSLKLGTTDMFICRDVALNDETAANLALQCRLKTI